MAVPVLQKDGLCGLTPWLSVVDDLAPEVLILVCDHVCENGECSPAAIQLFMFMLLCLRRLGSMFNNVCDSTAGDSSSTIHQLIVKAFI